MAPLSDHFYNADYEWRAAGRFYQSSISEAIGQSEAEKTHERQAIVDQKLGAFIGQIVRRLNDEDPEHHYRIERRACALRTSE